MPEAPMHKYGDAMSRKDNVRRARQVTAMEAKPITQAVKRTANRDFRHGVPLAYAGHHGTSLRVNCLRFGHSLQFPAHHYPGAGWCASSDELFSPTIGRIERTPPYARYDCQTEADGGKIESAEIACQQSRGCIHRHCPPGPDVSHFRVNFTDLAGSVGSSGRGRWEPAPRRAFHRIEPVQMLCPRVLARPSPTARARRFDGTCILASCRHR